MPTMLLQIVGFVWYQDTVNIFANMWYRATAKHLSINLNNKKHISPCLFLYIILPEVRHVA